MEEEDVVKARSALTTYARNALLITDLSVVRNAGRTSDPCDAQAGDEDELWTIGHMLKVEAARQGNSANDYVKNWLDAWATSTTLNGQTFTLDKLSGPLVRSNWPKDGLGNYRLHKAPFKLLAIVSRLDLRTVRPLGEPLGGEVRFIFAPMYGTTLVTPPPSDGRCMTAADDNSTIILEYSPAKADENAVVAWAKKWHALGSMAMGSTYRTELAKLTEEVLTYGRLLRIRTNEGPTGFWNLTEFEHDASTKFLKRSTVKQSPTEAMRTTANQVPLGIWIRDNKTAIQQTKTQPRTYLGYPIGNYAMPNTFPGTSTYLRGAFNELDSALSRGSWNATNPGVWQGEWDDTRHLFSLATCSGCHGKETGTGLLHVKNNNGGEATLSSFLSGPVTVPDPVVPTLNRQFNEMARREEDLNWLVSDGWVGVPVVKNTYTNPNGGSAAMNYKMVFWHSSKCIDLAGESQSDNAFVQQYTCHGRANQRVALVNQGQGYNLVFKHSGKCLDVQNSSTADGARVVQRTCNPNSTSQKLSTWFSSPNPGGRMIKFQHSGKCLLVKDQSTADAAQVIQNPCPDSSPNDRSFKFIE